MKLNWEFSGNGSDSAFTAVGVGLIPGRGTEIPYSFGVANKKLKKLNTIYRYFQGKNSTTLLI